MITSDLIKSILLFSWPARNTLIRRIAIATNKDKIPTANRFLTHAVEGHKT